MTEPATSAPRRMIRSRELQRRVPYSLVHIWRLEKQGLFPKRVPIGPHAVAWIEEEIDRWVAERIRAARAEKAAS